MSTQSLKRTCFGQFKPVSSAQTFTRSINFRNRNQGLSEADRAQFRANEQKSLENRAMDRNNVRDWKAGDVYAPHDLSGHEARKWKHKQTPDKDAFDALSINPLDLYKNFSIMSEYMTEMGRIRHSSSTGLRAVNQRKLSKAIRRAIAFGLMPSVHKHPMIIRKQIESDLVARGGRGLYR